MLFLLIPLYLLINLYILKRSTDWLCCIINTGKFSGWIAGYTVIYMLMAFSLLFAFILPKGIIQRFIKRISNIWLGVLMYIIIFVGFADLLKILAIVTESVSKDIINNREVFMINGAIVTLIVVGISIYGIINARIIKKKTYSVKINKKAKEESLKIVLIADLHLGYNTRVTQIKNMVKKINALNPDMVCIAGDFFDNEYDVIPQTEVLISYLQKIKSRYGVYACWGNHDIDERLLGGFTVGRKGDKYRSKEMEEFLEKSNIRVLSDESILLGEDVYLVGRLDLEKVGKENVVRKTTQELMKGLDKEKTIIVMEHQPKHMLELADEGADIGLYGHTHDGQLFPGTVLTRFMWENSYGVKKVKNMTSIVTSGIGCWGPAMRVGTSCEICEINVEFDSN